MRLLAITLTLAGCVDSFSEGDAIAVAQMVPSLCDAPNDVRGTTSCSNGGRLRIEGTVGGMLDGERTGALMLDGAAAFEDCAAGDGDEERPTLLDSEIDVSARCSITTGEARSEHTTLTGTFGWKLGDEAGRCEVDLVIESSYGACLLGGDRACVYETVTRGSVCGHPTNRRCTYDLISSCRDL